MTKKKSIARISVLSTFGLAATLLMPATTAFAQQQQPLTATVAKAQDPAASVGNTTEPFATPAPQQQGQEEASEAREFDYEPLRVGDATQSLLAWQRGGEISSTTPRTIAGNVANRSYERYLKSFEFPIPERMTSIVRQSSSNSGGGAIPK